MFFKSPSVNSSREIVKYLLSKSSYWPWVESMWVCMMEVLRKMKEEIILFFNSEFHSWKKGRLILKSQGFGMFCLYGINRTVCIRKSLITWAHTVQWNTILPELTNPHYSISRALTKCFFHHKIFGVCCTEFKNHYFTLNLSIHFQWQSKQDLTSLRNTYMQQGTLYCSNMQFHSSE